MSDEPPSDEPMADEPSFAEELEVAVTVSVTGAAGTVAVTGTAVTIVATGTAVTGRLSPAVTAATGTEIVWHQSIEY